jgi:sugar O-acyltransferase (sialic acid O-acetyltransferase NeuD family)
MRAPTPNTPLILWGATGQARVLGEFLPNLGWRIVALFDNDPSRTSPWPAIPVVGGEDRFPGWLREQETVPAGLAAIGGDRGSDRLRLQRWMAGQGCPIPQAIHPAAYVAQNASLGDGCQILAGAVVGADSQLGEAVLVNTSASVDHECVLGDGVHVGPGAVLCGLVQVHPGAFIGAGAVVLPRVTIGAGSIVGAGSVVTRDLPDNVVACGNPARIIRPRVSTPRNESA